MITQLHVMLESCGPKGFDSAFAFAVYNSNLNIELDFFSFFRYSRNVISLKYIYESIYALLNISSDDNRSLNRIVLLVPGNLVSGLVSKAIY